MYLLSLIHIWFFVDEKNNKNQNQGQNNKDGNKGNKFNQTLLILLIAGVITVLAISLSLIHISIFCRITAGVWMSRSSVVWGPFSIVWGLAIAAATAMINKY